MKQLIRVDTGYACFGLIAKDGIITDAAPISYKSVGRKVDDVIYYYKHIKKAEILIANITEDSNGKEQKEEKDERGQSDE